MHNNGVTHNIVCDDFEGVFTVLHWLSYMPKVSPSHPAAEPPEPGLPTTAHTASVFGVSSLWWRNCFMKYSSASYRFLFLAAIFGLLALNCLWISSVRALSDVFPSQKPLWSIWAQITVVFFLRNSHPSPRKLPIKCGYMEIKKQEYMGFFFARLLHETWDLSMFSGVGWGGRVWSVSGPYCLCNDHG